MRVALVFVVAVLLSACATPKPQMTPLEIQAMQTRQYENGKDLVFASVVSVFQDLGYTIKSADLDTGLIQAESATSSDALSRILFGVSRMSSTAATAFVERIGPMTTVRLNFVATEESSSYYGQGDRDDTPILNAQTYQSAFEKIESAIFVRESSS